MHVCPIHIFRDTLKNSGGFCLQICSMGEASLPKLSELGPLNSRVTLGGEDEAFGMTGIQRRELLDRRGSCFSKSQTSEAHPGVISFSSSQCKGKVACQMQTTFEKRKKNKHVTSWRLDTICLTRYTQLTDCWSSPLKYYKGGRGIKARFLPHPKAPYHLISFSSALNSQSPAFVLLAHGEIRGYFQER